MKHFLPLLFLLASQLSLKAQTTHFVDVNQAFYSPAALVINQGDIVEWNNVLGFHNVNGTQATFPGNAESFTSGAPSGAAWTYQKTFNVAGINNYMCDIHGIGMSGSITVNGPLPIELKYITTAVSAGICQVEWKTDKEENLTSFTLQKSVNAIDYSDVITIAANHTPSTYSYMDNMGVDRFVYYRVKIIDANNAVKYTPVRLAENDVKITKNTLNLLPNPYVEHFHISVLSVSDWSGDVRVYDFAGKTLHHQLVNFKEGSNYVHLDNSSFYPKGLYLVVVRNVKNKEFLSATVVKE